MERFRLKNIIILILVLLNGFLVSSLAQRRTAERDAFHRTAEQLAALFEENGMTLEPGAVPRDLPQAGDLQGLHRLAANLYRYHGRLPSRRGSARSWWRSGPLSASSRQ